MQSAAYQRDCVNQSSALGWGSGWPEMLSADRLEISLKPLAESIGNGK
jgi:hypothetical protein